MDTQRDILIEEEYEPDFFEEYSTKEDSNPVIEKEIKRFDDYSHSAYENAYEEYEVVQTYSPKVKTKQSKEKKEFQNFVDKQYSYEPTNETYTYQRTKPKTSLTKRTRGRILVYCCAFIAILLGALCIVNVVNITTIQLQNATTQTEISGIDKNITNAENSIEEIEEEIKDSDNQDSYAQTNNGNTYNIELIDKKQIISYESQTNFFDKICNFISNLFGG